MPVSSVKQLPPRAFIQPTGPVRQTSSSRPCISTSEMSVAQSTRMVSQNTTSQTPTCASEKVLSTTSVAGATFQQDPYSYFKQQTYPTSPVQPREEEDKVSDQKTGTQE